MAWRKGRRARKGIEEIHYFDILVRQKGIKSIKEYTPIQDVFFFYCCGPIHKRKLDSSDRVGPIHKRKLDSFNRAGPILNRKLDVSNRIGPIQNRELDVPNRVGPILNRELDPLHCSIQIWHAKSLYSCRSIQFW